jgi:lysophospholipase L1-like esterase
VTRTKRVFFIALLVVPTLISLVLIETALRWRQRGRVYRDPAALRQKLEESARTEVEVVEAGNLRGLVRPSADPERVYELKPSRRWLFRGGVVRTNSDGLRGPERAVPKGAGVLRVVGLGDSVQWGWGVNQDETYLSLLETLLSSELQRPVETINLAVPGYNTVQEAATLRAQGWRYEPDVIVLNYTTNDWTAPFFVRQPGERDGLLESSEVVRLIRAGLERLRPETASGIELQGVARRDSALAAISESARQRHVPVVFFCFGADLTPEMVARHRDLALRHDFRFVDLRAVFETERQARRLPNLYFCLVASNDPHPNAIGHAIIARALQAPLTEILRARR